MANLYSILSSILLLLLGALLASAEISADAGDENSNLKTLTRLINDCGQQQDVTICFKMKAVSFLDRLVRAPAVVPITEFMSLTRDTAAPEENETSPHPATEQELEATLPRSLDEKSRKLDDLLWSKFATLLSTRKVNFNAPSGLLEGRGKDKMKKGGGMMMMMAMMGGMMMKMTMGGIGMMAGKALMISKIALILAVILLLKKMQSGGEEKTPQVVYAAPEHGGGGGYHRRQSDAQNLAYGSHNPDF